MGCEDTSLQMKLQILELEELIGTVTSQKHGLMPSEQFSRSPHYVKAYDIVYKLTKEVGIWERDCIVIQSHNSALPFMDEIGLIRTPNEFIVNIIRIGDSGDIKTKYYKKNNDVYVSFAEPSSNPNNAFIMSPYMYEAVGKPNIIDESFSEIYVKTLAK